MSVKITYRFSESLFYLTFYIGNGKSKKNNSGGLMSNHDERKEHHRKPLILNLML
jgi:hypothetical protein